MARAREALWAATIAVPMFSATSVTIAAARWLGAMRFVNATAVTASAVLAAIIVAGDDIIGESSGLLSPSEGWRSATIVVYESSAFVPRYVALRIFTDSGVDGCSATMVWALAAPGSRKTAAIRASARKIRMSIY